MSSTGVLDAMLGVMFGQGPGVFGGHGSRSLFDLPSPSFLIATATILVPSLLVLVIQM
jgi:hypothetical protein